MPAGDHADGLSARQRWRVERAIEDAERSCGLTFGVWIGRHDGSLRQHALQMLARTDDGSGRTVVVAVDPGARALEIVTGPAARRLLDDQATGFAAASMTSAFLGGNLVGGVVQGLASMADRARAPRTLHLD